jgi:voltage-gated potassium channel Kch
MLLGSGMIILTTVIQGGFTIASVAMLRRRVSLKVARSNFQTTLLLSYFVLWLFVATIIEVWAWALLYLIIGAAQSLEEAAYFSTVTFTTLGYGDITLDESWRLLSSFEGANGLLMFGWSTALIFAAVQRVYELERKLPHHHSK